MPYRRTGVNGAAVTTITTTVVYTRYLLVYGDGEARLDDQTRVFLILYV